MRIVPARRPILMASYKVDVIWLISMYILYVLIEVVCSEIETIGLTDYLINLVFICNVISCLLLYVERIITVYYFTDDKIIRVRKLGLYKNVFRLKYSDIRGKVKYYEYGENIGAIYINTRMWAPYWDNSRILAPRWETKLRVTTKSKNKAMVLYYIKDVEKVCEFINQQCSKHNK